MSGNRAYGNLTINKTINVDSGNSQLLPCDSSVHSPDTFKWKRGGEFLSPDKSRIIQLSNGSLLVRNVSTIDSGYYLCVADDKILYNVTINVKVKVEVQMELRITNVEYTEDFQNESSDAYLEFKENFTTAMNILYNKTEGYKGVIILNIRNGSTKVDFKVIIVRVVKKPGRKEPEIKVEVTGKIITTITKSNGYIKSLRVDTDPKTLQLKVEPPVPKEPKMEEVKATSVVIAWSEPENHQYYNIKGYIVGLRKFGSGNEWLNESVEGTGTRKYSVRNLEPETQYYVNVAAQNKYGRGVATEPKALTTEKAGLAGWAVAIIVVLLLVLVAVAVAVFWYRKKRIAREERRRINYLEMAEKEKQAKFNPYDDKGRLESWNVGFSEVDCSCVKIPWDHLELSKLLGSGAFGEVYKGQVVLEGDRTVECAVKTVKDNATEEEKRDLYKELEIMSTVGSHPNLVNLIGASMKGDKLYIAIEFAAKGCLLDYLRDNRVVKDGGKETRTDQVDTNTKLMLALDVANGMAYLATKRCIHRDLAARNVLLTENCRGKVADFGMSRDIYSEGVYEKKTAGKLPIRWMALEAIETFMFTAETDVWSYGVLLWEIETAGVTPWGGLNAKEIVNALKSGKRLERPEGCAQEIYEIMLSCWKADPKARPSFKNLAERFEKLLDGKQETEDEKRKDANIC